MEVLKIFLIFFIIFIHEIKANDSIRILSQRELLQDFDVLVVTLKELHGNIFSAIDKYDYDELCNQIKEKIQAEDSISLFEFYHKVIPAITSIKCGHTNIFMENDEDFMINNKLNIRICDTNVFIGNNDFNLPKHTRILEFNHKPISNVIIDIKRIIPTDVTSSNYRIRKIEKKFLYYFNLINNYRGDIYNIKFINKNGEIRVQTIKRKDIISNNTKEIKSPLTYSTQSGSAYLKIKSFYTPDFKNYNLPPKKTFKRIFKQIQKSNIDTLLIDLRDNEGGSVVLASYIFSFLVNHKYHFYQNMTLSPITNYRYSDYIQKKPFIRFKRLLTTKSDNRRIYKHKLTHLTNPKKKCHFNGKIVLIVNGATFSAASIFASMLKSETNALIIGEETGGSYSGNGVYQASFYLPNSKLKIVCPFTYVDLNIIRSKQTKEEGISPDILIDKCTLDTLNKICDIQQHLFQFNKINKEL